jgi:hypothetical protein
MAAKTGGVTSMEVTVLGSETSDAPANRGQPGACLDTLDDHAVKAQKMFNKQAIITESSYINM